MTDHEPLGDREAALAGFEQGLGLVAVFAGPDCRIAAMNATARAMLDNREVIGRPAREALFDLAGQQLIEQVEGVYRTGRPFQAPEVRMRVETAAGTRQEVFVHLSYTPWRHADGRIRGVLVFGMDVTEPVLARRAAEAESADLAERHEHARTEVPTVQRALLPTDLPLLPGVRLAARYLLAEQDCAAGGDWFDAVPLPDGRIALVVGDVVGHGVAASAVMGQLRTVLRERLGAGAEPADALRAVERYAAGLPGARGATLCVAALDVGTGELAYCTAGHPPPLLVSADGVGRYLPPTGSGPLATGSTVRLETGTLAAGEVLLLYSDGIVERPGREPAQSTVELAQVAADAAMNRVLPKGAPLETVERVCEQTVEVLIRGTGYRDDITLLAVERVPPPPVLELELPAEPRAVREVRSELDHWLFAVRADTDDLLALQHAVGELVTNAVEHAYPSEHPHRTVAVRAVQERTGEVCVSVADRGRWRETPANPLRGNGLVLAEAFVDELRIDRREHGTTVVVGHRLTRPARLLTTIAPERRAAHRPEPFGTDLLPGPEPRLAVRGAIDVDTAPALRAELTRASHGGTTPVVVDLSRVTHLASAGVQVLYELVHQAAGQRLHAPPGTVAQHVLATVALPHD
ncbi:SpoIIE family protein phosphatase [Actinophytocola gossypii]|uniref:SpoIIE family protein phosphatase n=1 Tax=Actinophytocola gossypii TaxID=2812003 RepID=A0ABT2JIR4_9PSEU|nr:SpoIIE family protein phosphatase [Actinophytocola gossypii]MCT2587671.1 SpoIIE family protein phosphatase [Actinophytocola gossypii]